MDQLSASDWTTIRSALQDVMDTFFKLDVQLTFRNKRRLTKFHEKRNDNLSTITYALKALYVPENRDDTTSQANQDKKGYADLTEGILYFNYQYLLTYSPPLIENGIPVIVANRDSVIVFGGEATIIGVNLVGPTESNFQLVKVHWKKILDKSRPVPVTTNTRIFDNTFDNTLP